MRQYCNRCKQLTKHKVIHEYSQEYTPIDIPEMEIDYAKGTWEIIECFGCEQVSFCETWINSEDIDYDSGIPVEHIKLYPERKGNDLEFKQFEVLPSKIKKLYLEAIKTLNMTLYFSCTACLRSIIEAICSNVGINEGRIEEKIDKLFEKGFLTKKHAEALHEHRLIGNKALHELQIPTKEELVIAIRIIEHTLENIYELQDKFEELKFLREKRVNRQK